VTANRFDLVSIGFSVLDILARHVDELPTGDDTGFVEEIQITAAGTAAAPAVIAARHGLTTRLIGCTADDFVGQTLLRALDAEGVELSAMQSTRDVPTSATILPITSSGDRPNLHRLGSALMMAAPDAADVSGARFVHYGGVGLHPMFDGEGSATVLAAAEQAGAIVTSDTISASADMLPAVEAVAPHLDYFMPRADEAQTISSTSSPEAAARFFLDRGVGTCIFKNGAEGSIVYTPDRTFAVPAFSVDVVDTTGCGDSFCGGFITGLAKGMELEEACRFASATAALVAGGLGSQGLVTDFEHTLEAMTTMKTRSTTEEAN
jgi:sugar/nucleoside kinase (ribokinase family)